MIDIALETVITLAQAADELPRRRRERKIHLSTLYRWTTCRCRGLLLETLQIGETRCTSREALQRFFERLSTQCRTEPVSMPDSAMRVEPAKRTLAQRERAAAEAGRKLADIGT